MHLRADEGQAIWLPRAAATTAPSAALPPVTTPTARSRLPLQAGRDGRSRQRSQNTPVRLEAEHWGIGPPCSHPCKQCRRVCAPGSNRTKIGRRWSYPGLVIWTAGRRVGHHHPYGGEGTDVLNPGTLPPSPTRCMRGRGSAPRRNTLQSSLCRERILCSRVSRELLSLQQDGVAVEGIRQCQVPARQH